MKLKGTKLIFAHRGASAYAPENTLPAFRLAAEMHAFGVELDVHLTRDGKIVVAHDDRIDRMSDGHGLIREQTLDELRQYSFNCGKSEFGRVEIPTLEDVYRLLEPTGLYVNVEIKASGTDFVHMVHDCARDCGMTERVIYSSFNHWNLTDMLEYDKDAFVAPLYGSELVKPADYAHSFGARAIHPHYGQILAHPDIVARANELGVRVHPWTVDDPEAIKRLCELDVGAIITNKPDVALEIAQG